MNCKGLHFGWVVLMATFYINLVVDGYCFVFGIIRLNLEEDYPNYPTWMVAIIGGLVPAIYMGISPVCMAINDFLGPTRVIIFASLISTVAFIFAWLNVFFQAGFYFDLFMLGIFQGISSALLYGPSIAVVAQYFPPHQRSLAAGITTCGSPVGAIFYSLIIPPLFEAYGWRGALLIFSCFNLNGIVCALVFLETLKPGYKPPKKVLQRRRQDESGEHRHHHHHHHHHKAKPGSETSSVEQPLRTNPIPIGDQPQTSQGTYQIPPFTEAKNYPIEPSVMTAGGSVSSTGRIGAQEREQEPQQRTFVDVLKLYFNPKLVFQWSFICLLIAAAFSIVGYYIPMLLVTAQSKNPAWKVSLPVQANLVTMWGVFNTIGRVITGRLADLGVKYTILTSYWIFIIGLTISAIILMVFPFLMFLGDVSFVIFVLVYGLFIAPVITMRSIIVADMYGEENASASFGWFLCVQGMVQILGFILPAILDSLSALYAYGFGCICFLLGCVFVAVTYKPFFAMRKKAIEALKEKERAAAIAAAGVPPNVEGASNLKLEYVF